MSNTPKMNEKKQVLQVYAIFAAALILSTLPFMMAAMLSVFFWIGLLIVAYVLRGRNTEGSLIENHMTFLISTIWVGGLLAVVTMVVGSFYMLEHVDHASLMPCLDQFVNIDPYAASIENMSGVMGACMDDYVQQNLQTFIISGIIIAAPVLLYFLARFAKGFMRAKDGYRLQNPKSWF